MKTLPKLSEYVLQKDTIEHWSEDFTDVVNYTNFLTQPLNLSHFVPAIEKDGNWIVLELQSYEFGWMPCEERDKRNDLVTINNEEYRTALSKVIFEGFEVKERSCNDSKFKYVENGLIAMYYFNETSKQFEVNTEYKTIEDLIRYNLELNETIIKKFNL